MIHDIKGDFTATPETNVSSLSYSDVWSFYEETFYDKGQN